MEIFFEFLIFGVIMGITEDIIAIVLATDAKLTWQVFAIATAVTIPFAIIGELIVDKPDSLTRIMKIFKKQPR